jgi:hypothetical protein
MKLSSLINLVTDAQDVLDLFDGVTDVNQLRGRLRRINQLEADDLLTCLEGLQTSITAALNDTLEMNPDLDEPTDETMDDLTEDTTLPENPTKDHNPEPSPPPET